MALYRKNGTLVEKLDYRNIRHIEVLEEPDGEIHAIRFWTTEGKVGLQGFENMRTLLKKMEPYVHDLVVIRRHRLRISRKNPFLLHTMIMGATGMLYGIFRWFPESVELTPYLSCILIGLFFFLARPLSGPFGANCRRWELGLGFIFMVLFGIKLLG